MSYKSALGDYDMSIRHHIRLRAINRVGHSYIEVLSLCVSTMKQVKHLNNLICFTIYTVYKSIIVQIWDTICLN